MMKKNIGCLDRIIRFLVFDLLLGYTLFGAMLPQTVNFIFVGLALYAGLTCLLGWSPIYKMAGWNTTEPAKDNLDNENLTKD